MLEARDGLHVLVVDDEINIRKTLAIALETEGHKVTAVSNFQDALAEASHRSFELAFVDLRLGTDDGLDLIPALLLPAHGDLGAGGRPIFEQDADPGRTSSAFWPACTAVFRDASVQNTWAEPAQ